ncbi:HEAT repeat domain-containing protein [Geobacter sp. AOG2]|uniref:HEAT repeat domain-containing protein n=1 Tax=Geobacter sp. AOG2 TaxID=1566347 RepID=UPI001CC498BF|nr:HEAT repeat domain-containing protein [Geobacter sp. AOG2]GFE61185.1 PBS lyase [Geobacter sp. AOG2]
MNKQPLDIPTGAIDTRLLASLIIELNISRRHFKAYPAGHPVIDASLNKVIALYARLMEAHDEIIIATTKNALLVENASLDEANLVFRDFAGVLFEHGIGALVLRKYLTVEELRSFNLILGLKREEVNDQGGIEKVWEQSRIGAIGIRAIRYDLFSTTEDDVPAGSAKTEPSGAGLWERFARGVLDGSLWAGTGDDSGIGPKQLAQAFNRRYRESSAGEENEYIDVFADLLDHEESDLADGGNRQTPGSQIATFVANLDPGLRSRLLSKTFTTDELSNNTAFEEIIGHMPHHVIEGILDDIDNNNINVPPAIVAILRGFPQQTARGTHGSVTLAQLAGADAQEKLRMMFSEHAAEEQAAEESPPAAKRHPPPPSRQELELLRETMQPGWLESHVGEIILRLAITGDDPTETENLARNLGDMCGYLLQTGDYHQLLGIIEQTTTPPLPPLFRDLLWERFSRRDFLDEILNGLTTWGKSRFDDIRLLVETIGTPFIEPLLDSLAVEESMSLRRFMMDCLLEFGPAAKEPILARLDDQPWYYLRNLLIMLRSLDDPEIIPHIRPLVMNRNAKVRQDALRTLLSYNDPIAERQILRDLENSDKEVRLAAIGMAEKSQSTDVFKKLLAIVTKSGLSPLDVELKSTAIQSLKEIGREEALPELLKILGSMNLIRAKALNRLKLEIVRSLEGYPAKSAVPILEKIARGNDELAQQAEESLRAVRMKSHGQ